MDGSFVYRYTGIADVLSTVAKIEYEGVEHEIKAIWDTGCNKTIVNNELADRLSLISIRDGVIGTISDKKAKTKVYEINLKLPGKIEFQDFEVISADAIDTDILIGMDIISLGDFSITNYNGKTMFAFRIPSMGNIAN